MTIGDIICQKLQQSNKEKAITDIDRTKRMFIKGTYVSGPCQGVLILINKCKMIQIKATFP